MNQDPDKSPAEAVLQNALQAERPPDVPPRTERHDRIQKAVRGQSAAHDVGQFMLGNVFAAMGKVLLALWHLVTGSIDSSKNNTNLPRNERDDNHS